MRLLKLILSLLFIQTFGYCQHVSTAAVTMMRNTSFYVNAGVDQTINSGSTATMAATVTGTSSYLWTTSGSGTFDNSALEDPVYTPSANDLISNYVTLTLTAGSVTDNMRLSFINLEYWQLLAAGTTAGLTLPDAAEQTTTNLYLTAWNAIGGFARENAKYLFINTGGDTFSRLNVRANWSNHKTPVTVATTANITLSGEQTLDGVLTSSSSVLVKNQTTAANNGIYTSASGAWTRRSDADTGIELQQASVRVTNGTASGGLVYYQSATPITIGTTGQVWTSNFSILPVNTVTFTDDGRSGNGTSSYDRTTYNPAASTPPMILTWSSIIAQTHNTGQANTLAFGSTDGSGNRISFSARNTSDQFNGRLNSSNVLTIGSQTDGSGVYQWNAGPTGRTYFFRNGVYTDHSTYTLTNLVSQGIFLHAQQNSGGTADTYGTRVISSVSFGTRIMAPAYPLLNALKTDDDSYLQGFLDKITQKISYSSLQVSGSTSEEWDAICPVLRSDGKYDFIAGDGDGDIFYFEQGASITSWTKTLLVSTGHDVECVGIWGRDGGKLVIISVHSEAAPEAVRIHKATTTNDKGSYTTTTLSTTLHYAKSLYIGNLDADADNEFIVAWQGNSTAEGGLSWFDWNGSTITTAGNWTQALGIGMSNMWNIAGFDANNKLVCSGRNYPERFTGGTGPGVHLITIPSPPTSTWTSQTIYNTVSSEPALGRIRDHLHCQIGNYFGTGSNSIANINYDTGEIFFLDDQNSYAATIYDPKLCLSWTNLINTSLTRNGRTVFITVGEDTYTWMHSWNGTAWEYQRLSATSRHPSDGQKYTLDIDNNGTLDVIYASGQVTYSGLSDGEIKILYNMSLN